MHVLTLRHRIMAKCKISCGDIEMAKRRLGETRIIFKFGIFSSSIRHYLKVIKKN